MKPTSEPLNSLVPSIFHTNAEKLRREPGIRDGTYYFKNVESWFNVGLQALSTVGRHTDSALPKAVTLDKCLHPINASGQIIIRNSKSMY